MHSSTLFNDFSSRLTLAFAPFSAASFLLRSVLPQQIPCSQTFADSFSLLALFSTFASFVFSTLRTLFAKHRGVGVPLRHLRACPFFRRASALSLAFFCRPFIFIRLQIPSRRASIRNILCFHALTNPFFHNFFVFTSIQNARVSPHLTTFLPIRRGSASRQSTATRDVFHTSFLVYAQRSRGAFATFPNPCYRPHIQGGFAKCQ